MVSNPFLEEWRSRCPPTPHDDSSTSHNSCLDTFISECFNKTNSKSRILSSKYSNKPGRD